MRAFFTCPVNLNLPSDYPTMDNAGDTYAIWNRYSVELPPGMDNGEGYVRQLQAAGELWRLATYENTHDSNGDNMDRPALPDLRDEVDYEGSGWNQDEALESHKPG
jgi:hypothetical protein